MEKQLAYIYRIDLLLDALLNKIHYQEYVKFIKGNEALQIYDKILTYIQIRLYPIGCLKWLELDYLNYVYDVIFDKLKRSI